MLSRERTCWPQPHLCIQSGRCLERPGSGRRKLRCRSGQSRNRRHGARPRKIQRMSWYDRLGSGEKMRGCSFVLDPREPWGWTRMEACGGGVEVNCCVPTRMCSSATKTYVDSHKLLFTDFLFPLGRGGFYRLFLIHLDVGGFLLFFCFFF